jgi:hypothetical protein
MNRYGQMVLNRHREFRPDEFAQIENPTAFFTEVGEEIQAAVSDLRDQILAGQRPWEDLEDYRRRSTQALAEAEEVIMADHHLLTPQANEDEDLTQVDDPILASYYRALATGAEPINQAF